MMVMMVMMMVMMRRMMRRRWVSENCRHPGAGRDPVVASMASFSGFRHSPE